VHRMVLSVLSSAVKYVGYSVFVMPYFSFRSKT
jgi:hypothetical protein